MKFLRYAACLLLMVLPCLVTAAERVLEVIPLKHRLVQEVIPVLQPLVEPGGSLTGMHDQLIIKSSPTNIAAIKRVLHSLDHAPRQLLITVKQDTGISTRLNEQNISGRYAHGDVELETLLPPRRRDLEVGIGRDNGNQLKYSLRDRQRVSDDRNTYRVRATEGYPAFIEAGQFIPLPNRNVTIRPDNVVVQDGYQYQDATSGFYVLPRVRDDTVSLEIAPRLRRVQQDHGPPLVQLQDVQTVIEGRLGEWIPVGGIDQSEYRQDRRLLGNRSIDRNERSGIVIKVETLQ